MTELYLIAHKVSGAAAFDVAEKMTCPECSSGGEWTCPECDGFGYWWIIPTSGHRAYPYAEIPFRISDNNELYINEGTTVGVRFPLGDMPISLQDHYRHGPAPKVDIKALFKKSEWVPNPEAFIKRRL